MTQALLTLGAVVLGGLIAVAGSVVTSRRELRRGYRVDLFNSLLPELRWRVVAIQNHWQQALPVGYGSPTVTGDGVDVKPLIRAAALAGDSDSGKANPIAAKWAAIANAIRDCPQNRPGLESVRQQYSTSVDELVREIDEFSSWLLGRIRHRWW